MSSWTDQDNERVMSDLPLKEIAKVLNRTVDAVRQQRFMLRKYQHISPSPYPKYTEPTQITTDRILVLPDLELPFHNSDFVNRVVDLALSWKVETILAAGDMFHLDALTGWEANWKKVLSQYMDEKTKDRLNEVFMKIKDARVREEAFEAIDDLEPKTGESFGEEIKTAKKVVSELSVFKNKYHIMGNHEGRLLRMVNSSMEGVNISDMFAMKDWVMSEFYFAEVFCKDKFRIAHPKPYGKNAPAEMASRFLCHYIMGHSHDWSVRRDRSGKFWAISMGHCADERLFPYESQRDRTYWSHSPGAVIIVDGFPHLLEFDTPWQNMKRMYG
jgi:hypothetical protein